MGWTNSLWDFNQMGALRPKVPQKSFKIQGFPNFPLDEIHLDPCWKKKSPSPAQTYRTGFLLGGDLATCAIGQGTSDGSCHWRGLVTLLCVQVPAPRSPAFLGITHTHLWQVFFPLTHLQESSFLLHKLSLSMHSQMLAPCNFSSLVLALFQTLTNLIFSPWARNLFVYFLLLVSKAIFDVTEGNIFSFNEIF